MKNFEYIEFQLDYQENSQAPQTLPQYITLWKTFKTPDGKEMHISTLLGYVSRSSEGI